MTDVDARVRLEGGAELLEATRLRYRLLLKHLRAVFWQQRLRTAAPVLREVTRVQPDVDQALERATRHAKNEQWPESSALLRCVREVATQRAQLETATLKRLGRAGKGLAFAKQLEALENKVLTTPRLVLPGQRWASAKNVLPWPSAELTRVAHFAERLESVFARPLAEGAKLLFSLEAFDAVANGWAAGTKALDAVWSRLEAIDTGGVLVRYLRGRARRTPTRSRSTGPDVLLHAEFWRTMATSRIDAVLADRVGPVVVGEGERFAVLRWVWQVDRAQAATLTLPSPERAALIELAQAVNALPGNRKWGTLWPKLLERASVADRAPTDPDWKRLHDSLALLARVLESPATKAIPPLYRTARKPPPAPPRRETPETLVGVLRAMQTRVG